MAKYRSALIIVLVTLITMFFLGGYFIITIIGQGNTALIQVHNIYMEQFDLQVKQEVQTATTVLTGYQLKVLQGQLSEVEAQKQAAAIIRGLRYGKDGYLWIDTTSGMNIANLGKDTEGKSRWDSKDANGVYFIQEIIKNGSKEDGGYTEYNFPKPDDKSANPVAYPKRSYSLLFKPWNWVIGTGNYYDNIDQIIATEKLNMQKATYQRTVIGSSLAVLALLINLLIAWLINRKTQRDVKEMTQFSNQLADGNFTIRSCAAGGEMKIIGSSLLATVESLRTMISNVKESVTQVGLTTEGLNEGAEQSAQASAQVAGSISEIANMLDKQLRMIEDITAQMQQVSSETVRVEYQSKEAMNRAKTSEQAAQNGKQALDHATKQMGQIQASVEQTAQVVLELGQRSQDIGKINDTIKSIAEQTNLLALNAAIEAARAGEHGRGFSVVAEEVRKLADGSSQAARQIAELIKTIQDDTQKANQSMTKSINEVSSGNDIVTQAGVSFIEITNHVQEVSMQIQEIAKGSSEIQQTAKRVTQSTQDMLVQNSIFSAEVQSISSATEQQTASAEEIASSSQVLADMMNELRRMIERFRI